MFILQLPFWVTTLSNWTSIKCRGVAINTIKVHINNMYIQYTLVHFVILLIRQVSRAVPVPVTISFVVEALSSRLGSSFGFLHGSSNLLAILLWSSSFFPFALFLKLLVLLTINTWCYFLISTFVDFSIAKSSGIIFRHPLHTIVHHEVPITWWWWLENSVNHYLIWKINSHLIQAIAVPRHSEHMLTSWAILLHLLGKVLVKGLIPLDMGMSPKYQFQLLDNLICSMAFKTFLKSQF